MKKYMKILIIVPLVILLTACSTQKKPLDKNTAMDLLTNEGFVVSDNISYMEDKTIKTALSGHNGKNQIEYYIFDSKKRAKEAYDGNKKSFNANGKKAKEKRKETYNKYTQELTDMYNVLVHVDNTLIYASINIEYKKDLNKVLKELNY